MSGNAYYLSVHIYFYLLIADNNYFMAVRSPPCKAQGQLPPWSCSKVNYHCRRHRTVNDTLFALFRRDPDFSLLDSQRPCSQKRYVGTPIG